MIHARKERTPRRRRNARPAPSMHIVPAPEAPARRQYGMSGWQTLAVVVVCVALMTVTFFLAPT